MIRVLIYKIVIVNYVHQLVKVFTMVIVDHFFGIREILKPKAKCNDLLNLSLAFLILV